MSKSKAAASPKRKRGRPPVMVMPERIPDTPENVMRAICGTPPSAADDWDFLKPADLAI